MMSLDASPICAPVENWHTSQVKQSRVHLCGTWVHELLSVHQMANGSAAAVVLQYIDVDSIPDIHSGPSALPPTFWGERDCLDGSSSPGPGPGAWNPTFARKLLALQL